MEAEVEGWKWCISYEEICTINWGVRRVDGHWEEAKCEGCWKSLRQRRALISYHSGIIRGRTTIMFYYRWVFYNHHSLAVILTYDYTDNTTKHIHNGPPNVQKGICYSYMLKHTNTSPVPHAHPVPKGRQPILTKSIHLLQKDEDLRNNNGAVHPKTSADHPSSAQVTETPTLPAVLSPTHGSDHPAELAPDDGQSVLVPDAPLPLPQNLLQSSSDICLSLSLSGHNVLDSHHADSRRADNTHSCKPHDNWHPHNHGQSWEACNINNVYNPPLNDGYDLHRRQDNSPCTLWWPSPPQR